MKRKLAALTILCLTVWLVAVGYHQTHKALPQYLDYRGEVFKIPEGDIEFLYDLTWIDEQGEKHYEQQIFKTIFELIEKAERYILVDMFLFNSYGGKDDTFHRDLSSQLTELLVDKKNSEPEIHIDLITDPINTVYGGSVSPEIERLRGAGINVIVTELDGLRDSNFLYSSFWRTFLQWFGNSTRNGWLPHPFSTERGKVTLRSYLRLLNFKANHRKVVVVDSGEDMVTVVGSANPHGGSSAHSNVALLVRGPLWRSVYQTETAVAAISGDSLQQVEEPESNKEISGEISVRILTEQQIKKALLEQINRSESTDSIKIAQFYLADRELIDALADAAERGTLVRVILDPNKDAFGYEKNGIPNRQAGYEMTRRSAQKIQLRWYDTHGEQFHTKLFILESGGQMVVLLGSANLTRRNLDNYNLELDVMLVLDEHSATALSIKDYYNRIWNNESGIYTVGIEAYDDGSLLKKMLYRAQEAYGLSTF